MIKERIKLIERVTQPQGREGSEERNRNAQVMKNQNSAAIYFKMDDRYLDFSLPKHLKQLGNGPSAAGDQKTEIDNCGNIGKIAKKDKTAVTLDHPDG